jgi:hypothetical protein
MSGDALAILLFFLTCTLAFGTEAVKAETAVRRLSFSAISLLCLLTGAFWTQTKTAWPSLSQQIAVIATNPVSWFVVIMFFLAVFAFHRPGLTVQLHPKNTPDASEPEPDSKLSIPKERIFVDVTPQFLVGLRKGRTTAEGARLLRPYVGKWMKLSGPVNDVSPPDTSGRPSLVISFEEKTDRASVVMFFDQSRWERLSTLRAGQTISVQGEISDVHSSILLMLDCEIIAAD